MNERVHRTLKAALRATPNLYMTRMWGKAENEFSPNLNFLRLAVLKILQFKIINFPRNLVFPF